MGAVSLNIISRTHELILYVIVIELTVALSAFSLGLIHSLRFVERVIEVIVLLNKPLNCTSVSLPLFPRELDTLHFGARDQD